MLATAKKVVSAADYTKIRRERVEPLFQLDPVVTITLKEKKYTLEFNNWAIKGVLKDTGINMISMGFSADMMSDPMMLGSVFYWAMATHQPEMTQDDTDKLFTYKHYAYVLEKLRICVDLFLPDMSDIEIDMATGRTVEDEDPR